MRLPSTKVTHDETEGLESGWKSATESETWNTLGMPVAISVSLNRSLSPKELHQQNLR